MLQLTPPHLAGASYALKKRKKFFTLKNNAVLTVGMRSLAIVDTEGNIYYYSGFYVIASQI